MAEIDPKKIGLAVITSYPKWYTGKLRSIKHIDKVRGDLALKLAKIVSGKGYYLVIADSKSSKTFLRKLSKILNIQIIKRRSKGGGEAKRIALNRTSVIPGIEVILLTEAEKISIVRDCIKQIVEPILQNKADIVVPKREERLFKATYPRYMYYSEKEGNSIYNEALRSYNIPSNNFDDLDMFFGPRALRNNRKIIALFKRKYLFPNQPILEKIYNPDNYSNVLYFPIINAFREKLRVESIEVPFKYPGIQKKNENTGARDFFIRKRNSQRIGLLIDLMYFLRYLDKK